jgi:hypothetical protein
LLTNRPQSCRELKKYISEGRRIVHEIETETFEENPPLFREYMTASPEFKVLMDNQFKNVKTHARLLSKAMWYEWRMKLQDGLKEGLLKTAEGMDSDDQLLAKQQELLSSIMPDMVKRLEELELEHEDLQAIAQELADCDPQDLEDARADLAAVDKTIAEKTKQLEELRRELGESTESVESLTQQKQQYLEEIREADKIREECRGWSSSEISKLKGKQPPHPGTSSNPSKALTPTPSPNRRHRKTNRLGHLLHRRHHHDASLQARDRARLRHRPTANYIPQPPIHSRHTRPLPTRKGILPAPPPRAPLPASQPPNQTQPPAPPRLGSLEQGRDGIGAHPQTELLVPHRRGLDAGGRVGQCHVVGAAGAVADTGRGCAALGRGGWGWGH